MSRCVSVSTARGILKLSRRCRRRDHCCPESSPERPLPPRPRPELSSPVSVEPPFAVWGWVVRASVSVSVSPRSVVVRSVVVAAGGASAGAGSRRTTLSEIVLPRDQVNAEADRDGEDEPEQAEQHRARRLVPPPPSGRTTSARAPTPPSRVLIDADPPQRRASASTIARPRPVPGPVGAAPTEPFEDAAARPRPGLPVPRRALPGARFVVPRDGHGRPRGRVHERVLDQVVERDRDILVGGAHERVTVALEREPVPTRPPPRKPALVTPPRMRAGARRVPAAWADRRRGRG